MFDLREYHLKSNKISSFVPWGALVAPGVILNDDGSFQKTYKYRGYDLASSTDLEMINVVARLNNIVKRFGSGWCIWFEAQRNKSQAYPQREFPDLICALVDVERKNYFNSGNHYESNYYLTIQWLPPSEKVNRAGNIFYVKDNAATQKEAEYTTEMLQQFITAANRFYDSMRELTAECSELTDEETLTYLHSTVSNSSQAVKVPVTPAFLSDLLCDAPFKGGMEPELGYAGNKLHLALISILSFPPVSYPGILDTLNRLGLEYRWMTRYIALDKTEAESIIRKIKREWFAGHKSLITMIKETITKSESAMIETINIQRSDDADAALNEMGNDYCRFGYLSSVIVLKHDNSKTLDTNVRKIIQAYESQGFVVTKEDINAVGAWFGSIPGNAYANVRRPMMSTLNLCHLLPISAVWAGEGMCRHLSAPALGQTQTVGSTPFRLNIHVDDVGHTMVVGPTGAGKSVFLNFLAMQARGFKNSRIFVFDKGGSSRCVAAGVGGAFYDLGSETESNSMSFQPLRWIDKEDERIWASEWLQQIYANEGVQITPEHKADIWNALNSLSSTPAEERTIFGFYNLIQNMELRNAIMPFVAEVPQVIEGGPYGRLFDSDKDTLKLGSYQSFEMGELMNKKNAVLPTLLYLFHVIERSCDGSPTFIILDECWTFLDNPIFAEKIREWLKTMRKNNVAIIFATQNLTDIRNSSISSAIIESCLTKIFLPNANALNPADTEVYEYFNLNETERMIISKAIPKRQYYYKSILGSRLFELALSPFALAYMASASKEDQAAIIRFKTEFPEEDFNELWLKYKNVPKALKAYKEYKAMKII